MYFTDSRSLINEHITNNFKDRNVIVYLLFYYLESVLYDLFPREPSLAKAGLSIELVFYTLLIGTVCVLVLSKVLQEFWRANGGHGSRDFMNRVISLVWVFHFRASLILLPLMILFKISSGIESSSLTWPIVFTIIVAALYSLYYVFQNVKKSLIEIYDRTKTQD